jgi:SAM-dependent methyltransferase
MAALFCTLLLTTSFALFGLSEVPFWQKLPNQYQDIIVNGEVVKTGWGPHCADRYALMRPILEQFQRPITVLDLGANLGYFSLRIAQDYDATCVMADFQKMLLEVCRANTSQKHLLFLNHSFSAQDLKKLSETEHFDVVLALNVLHHLHPWEECLEYILKLGDQVIIETPPPNDAVIPNKPTVPAIYNALIERQGTILGHAERYLPGTFSTLFCFSNSISPNPPRGIHLSTFKAFNGIFPPLELISPSDLVNK